MSNKTVLSLPYVASLVYNTPLMITEAKLQTIMSFLTPRLYGGDLVTATEMRAQGLETRGLQQTETGPSLAVIPIEGILMNKVRGMDAFSGMQSYEQISASLDAAIANPNIAGVALQLATPGGGGQGAFDLADKIYNLRSVKPIYAVVDEEANSAGFLIASSATKIYMPRTGIVGSIGVRMQHVDLSELNAKMGIKYEDIYAGERKLDFASHKPLSDQARKDAQKDVDDLRILFAETVARNRSLSVKSLIDTEAAIYAGEAAITVGLADVVMSVEQAFDDILANLESDRSDLNMSVQNNSLPTSANADPGAGNPSIVNFDPNPITTTVLGGVTMPVLGTPAAPQVNLVPGEAMVTVIQAKADTEAAVIAERERITSIYALPEAEGKFAMCLEAAKQGLSLEAAKSLLIAVPEAPKVNVSPLNTLMDGTNPEIGAEGDGEETEEDTLVASILANGRAAGVGL